MQNPKSKQRSFGGSVMVCDSRIFGFSVERTIERSRSGQGERASLTARVAICLCLCFALSLSLSSPLIGQTSRGTVLGHVTDSTGSSISGAAVTLRNVNTGVAETFTTNATGDFVWQMNLPERS